MSQDLIKMCFLDFDSLQVFFGKFALMKILAGDNQVVENKDSFLIFNLSGRTPTSLGMTNHIFGGAVFKNKLQAEVKVMNERFFGFCARTITDDPMTAISKIHKWLDKHFEFCQKFYQTYSVFASELNEINRKMIKALGFGIYAGSVAQASAELALILTGIGLPPGRLVTFASVTLREIGLRAALGFEIGYAISVVEKWGEAGKADMMALTITEGDATNLVSGKMGIGTDCLNMAKSNNEAELGRLADGYKKGSFPALTPHSKAKSDAKVSKIQAPTRVKIDTLSQVIKPLVGINYLLSIKGTFDTLDKYVKRCQLVTQ